MKEIVKLRGETSKTYDRGNGKCRLVVGGGIQHWKKDYADKNEQWKECDLTWQGNRITKAPYDLVVQGRKVTFKDKKTGQISTIELLTSKCADPAHAGQDRTPNFEIIPFASGFRFQHRINADNLPFEAQFKVEGKRPSCNASDDDEGSLQVEVSFDEETGILTERLSEVKDAESGELRKAKGEIRIDPTLAIQPSLMDTYIRLENPDENYGAEVFMRVYDRDVWKNRALVSFNISDLPESAFIDDAELELYYYDVFEPGAAAAGKEVYAVKLRRNIWEEGTGTVAAPSVDGATWNIFTEEINWFDSGGDFLTGFPIHGVTTVPAAFGWMAWDVLHIVEDAQDKGIDANFLVKFPTEEEDPNRTRIVFHSKEYAVDPALQPKLTIDYSRMVTANTVTNLTETAARLNGETHEETALPAVVDQVGFVWDTRARPNPGLPLGDNFEWAFNTSAIDEAAGDLDWTGTGDTTISTVAQVSGRRSMRCFRTGGVNAIGTLAYPARAGYTFGYHIRRSSTAVACFWHGDAVSTIYFSFRNSGAGLRLDYNGPDNTWHATGATLAADTWALLEVRDIDWVAKTYALWLDGALVMAGVPMREAVFTTDRMQFMNIGNDGSTAYYDNVRIIEPGVAPDDQVVYANNWISAAGAYNETAFHHDLAALTPGQIYYYRAAARVDGKWYYSKERKFAPPDGNITFTGGDRNSRSFGIYHGSNPSMVHFEGGGRRRTFLGYQGDVVERVGIGGAWFVKRLGCDPFIVYYDWDDAAWYGPFQVGLTHIPGNPHSGCCLFIDGNDKLHVFFGSHGPHGTQQWTRSIRTLDVATPFTDRIEEDFETYKTFGTSVSYPMIMGVIGGNLTILMRGETAGSAHSRYESLWRSNNYEGAWGAASFAKIHNVIDSGSNNITVYLWSTPFRDALGYIHVCWMWYDETTTTYYNCLYAKYNIALDRWEQADGTPYVLPISAATAEVVNVIATHPQWQSAERIAADETGRPYIINLNDMFVWEAPAWVQRPLPMTWPILHVVSSNELYIFGRETIGVDTYCRRYTSNDRGANFHSGGTIGGSTFAAVRAAAYPSGTLPLLLAGPSLTYTNPVEPGDAAATSSYNVGGVYASLGSPLGPGPGPGPGPQARLIQARIL